MSTTVIPGPSQQEIDSLPPNVDLSGIGIFNAAVYGLAASASATDNAQAIQQALTAKEAFGGGVVMLPYLGGNYKFSGPLNPGVAPFSLLAQSGVQLAKQDAGTAFSFNGANDGRDILIRGFKISCAVHNTAPAFYITQSQNIRLENLFFANYAAANLDSSSLSCGMDKCTVQNDTQNNIIALVMNGAENYCFNSTIRQNAVGNNGPTGCTGFQLSATNSRMSNVHFSDWNIGGSIIGGAFNTVLTGLTVQGYSNALTLTIPGSGTIAGLVISDSAFALGQSSPNTSPIILVDPSGQQTKIDKVFFVACRVYNGLGYGYQVNGGTIYLVGGDVSGNTTAGVGVTGGTVYASGVSLSGTEPGGVSETQLLAYYVSASGNLYVRGGNATGNSNGVVGVDSPGVIDIADLTGYNDQKRVVTQTPPASGTPFSPASLGYYGRMVAYVGAVSEIDVAGTSNAGPFQNTGLLSGPIPFDPNEWGKLTYGSAPTFIAVGH